MPTGWMAGTEGGAKSIVAAMAGDGGTVRVFSTGSGLDGAPDMYVHSPSEHSGMVHFRQTASFKPFQGAGVHVATMSTTSGADLLICGPDEIRKFSMGRAEPTATTLTPTLVGTAPTAAASAVGGG